MLKKIAVSQLRLGMYLHKLEGKWLEHPFWRTTFVLDSVDDLRLLQASTVRECWIDPGLGLDVAAPVAPDAMPTASASSAASVPVLTAAPAEVAPPAAPRQRQHQTMAAELREASAICGRGRKAVMAMFNEARMGRSIDAEGCRVLVDDITASVERNPGALVSLARLKTRDDYSYMHSVAVCALMVALARQLGLNDQACREAGLAGLMHDIGKALMPLEVLNKPGRLTDAETRVIRSHALRGYELLKDGAGTTPEMLDVVLNHHERVDGTGYPRRLPAERLSTLARMGAICDVYDAITSNRPYKAGWDPAESIARMASWKGQFDEKIFAAFVQSLGIYPTGSLVVLASERLAVVTEQNPGALVKPVVKVFFSLRSQLRCTPVSLDLSRVGCTDRIVGRHQAAEGSFGRLEDLWLDPELQRRLPASAPA